METKDIDLTKCRGLAFKAKISGKECEGRIQVEHSCVYLCQNIIDGAMRKDSLGFQYSWQIPNGSKEAIEANSVIDFEIIPRDPETYRDWQVGDNVLNYNIRIAKDAAKEVIFRSGELVICKNTKNAIGGAYTCDELYQLGFRLVLTDIERQIIEEKKKAEWKPQDGDICLLNTKAGNRFIFIKRDNESDDEIHGYAYINTNSRVLYLSSNLSCVCGRESIRNFRPATDEEKQLLFDAMAKQGKRWNADKKVVEDITKPHEFRKDEPVLVRNDSEKSWVIRSFLSSSIDLPIYEASDGVFMEYWNQCIPYNEKTMHLLGTTEDYKEE